MGKEMELKSDWIRENVNPNKVMESFLWFTFSKISEEDLVGYLKEYRDIFRQKILVDEEEWIDKKNIKDKKIKKEYMEDVKEVVDKTTEEQMLKIQKMVGELHLDKDSWKKNLGWMTK
tara:strand:+ start:70 stop:423 length:354 start_codon:yes stop_codon:yes gene_type:complete